MSKMFRIALSYERVEAPAPHEPTPEVWVYEIEATGPEAALSEAEQRWRDERHIREGDSPRLQAVVTPA